VKKVKNKKPVFKVPAYLALIIIVSFFTLGFVINFEEKNLFNSNDSSVQLKPCIEKLNMLQGSGYNYICPLLMSENSESSSNLMPVKNKIQSIVEKAEQNGVKDLSVYLHRLNNGDWMGVNEGKEFNSTGYIRLALLITYLKMGESNPAILQKKLYYKFSGTEKNQNFNEVPVANYYSIKELLKFLMVNEDTTVKHLLVENINQVELSNLFKVLHLNIPDFNHRKFSINVAEYSKFLEILFNANYLNKENSEYALSLLYETTGRKNGMMKFLPDGSKTIHKYSERFNNNQYELRESGIIYTDKDIYQLTIFAAGKNYSTLDSASGSIGKVVYDWIGKL
jgi:hypothetical protein